MNVHKKHGRIINDKPFFSDTIETAQQELLRHSYNMILSHYVPEQNLTQYIQYIKGLPVSGLILMATELDEADLACYKALNIPMVLMDASFDLEELDTVTLDNQQSIFRAFSYGVELGHRSIGYLKSATKISNFEHRMDGFAKGLRAFGLEQEPHPVIALPCDVEGAYQAMSRFLDAPPEGFHMPTLFLSDLDYIALGAMNALKEHGYRIPEDVSIIGYDDVPTSAVSAPPLTTIRVNQSDIGLFAAKALMERMNGSYDGNIAMQISSRLIVRQSVLDLRKA